MPPLTWKKRLHWLLLAFVPSSLMLSVTMYITTDIAAIPLLWVVPLALYLLTFVIVFAEDGRGCRIVWWCGWMPLVVLVIVLLLLLSGGDGIRGVIGVVARSVASALPVLAGFDVPRRTGADAAA